MKFLSVNFYVLSLIAFAQEQPKTMIKMIVHLQADDIPTDSFVAKPKLIYRAGNSYGRIEEMPDPEHGIHGLMIVNEPDIWMVNLFTHTAQHMVDPGPTFNCRMPIFAGEGEGNDLNGKNLLYGLEFGRESEYFKRLGAETKEGAVLEGKPITIYTLTRGNSRLSLFTTGNPGKPWGVARKWKNKREIYWYQSYEYIPFDIEIFAKPIGMKIEDAKK